MRSPTSLLLVIAAPIIFMMGMPAAAQQSTRQYDLVSPDGGTSLRVTAGPRLQWSVTHRGNPVLAPSSIALEIKDGGSPGQDIRNIRATTEKRQSSFAALHYKKETVSDNYNELTLSINKGDYGIIFRAYDDGVAYRWFTQRKDSLIIRSETADFNFAADHRAWIAYVNDPKPDIYTTSFENFYQHIALSECKKDTLAFLPVLVDLGDGKKAAILEADLEDYPGMFVQAGRGSPGAQGDGVAGGIGLSGTFAPYSLEEKQGGHNQLQSFVTRRADYIAVTKGTRVFPWRILVLSDADKQLADNDMVYRLASPSRIKDTSWIRPGKVAWDWWNDWNISHVDFRAGINTETYRYYIDFAAANHIEYILLDEGWADSKDIMKIVPAIDLPAIIDYGRRKGVGVWLWGGWLPLDKKMDEALDYYSRLGIRGFKVDFMNRDDQKMVQFYYRLAEKAAARHVMLDFHGAYKPTGLQRTWPNVVNFEGVRGMENEKWSPNDDFPEYDVTIPYIRMLAGPLDYTPGAMKNANKANFRAINSAPMSEGTRCHQLAMYVVYEAPFSMLADNPTSYMREPESVGFIAGVPTFFDQTLSLDGQVGQYVAIARRKGKEWHVGAMSNWEPRDIIIDCSFLCAGSYEAEIFRDGINADRDATDYKKEKRTITAGDRLTVHLAPGGGWVARIVPSGDPVLVPPPAIAVNQLGFYPQAPKIAVACFPPGAANGSPGAASSTSADFFYILSKAGDTAFSGRLGMLTPSTNSSLSTRMADFSALKKDGTYRIYVPGIGESYPFRIGRRVMAPLSVAALKGYYYQRSAMPLEPAYAGLWSRPAGHPDNQVLIHPSAATDTRPAGTVISTPGGWYDAGDYNKYIVNSGITMGTLLDAYEDFAAYYDTLHTNIPPLVAGGVPAGDGGTVQGGKGAVPDLLNETIYNLRWMLSMQDPADGGVYNKCTNAAFDGMVMPGVTKEPRYVVQKGTAATLDFAAVMSQAARILRKFGGQLPGLSDSCLLAATHAWRWALQHPALAYDQEAMNRQFEPPVTTGGYGDRNFGDEWFWAAVELMVTTRVDNQGKIGSGSDAYEAVVRQHIDAPLSLPTWSNVQMMGNYTLLRSRNALPASWQPAVRSLQQRLLAMADSYIGKISSSAFHTVMGANPRDFVWGSNSVAANEGMLLLNAWMQQKDGKYVDAALGNLDYLLGRNATGYCFVTGMGSHSPLHPHHRPSIADGVEAPIPGLLAGGPNPGRQDRQHYTYTQPETAYTDQNGAYASNEIAINWNAPLVYLAGAIEAIGLQGGIK
ncbi:MAG TPA: glycoside hydrolase family 97 catalytic domain-containing protein [Puia sp.]|nr:glycoside hydrolase family 97 catalytic domain-containing protein [Puia sp.]